MPNLEIGLVNTANHKHAQKLYMSTEWPADLAHACFLRFRVVALHDASDAMNNPLWLNGMPLLQSPALLLPPECVGNPFETTQFTMIIL